MICRHPDLIINYIWDRFDFYLRWILFLLNRYLDLSHHCNHWESRSRRRWWYKESGLRSNISELRGSLSFTTLRREEGRCKVTKRANCDTALLFLILSSSQPVRTKSTISNIIANLTLDQFFLGKTIRKPCTFTKLTVILLKHAFFSFVDNWEEKKMHGLVTDYSFHFQ